MDTLEYTVHVMDALFLPPSHAYTGDIEAAERYEFELIEEARRIVAGVTLALPTEAHLRVLLNRLDGARPTREPPPVPVSGAPF